MYEITDRILALALPRMDADSDEPVMLPLGEVLEIVKDAIPVTFDPALHRRAPQNVREELVWGTLDTAYNLIREAAVQYVLADMRDTALEVGLPTVSTDEELFEKLSEGTDQKVGYRDLAVHSRKVAEALEASFKALVNDTVGRATYSALEF